jgi:cytochrome c
MALAGGVGTLASDQPVRTIGSKLNYATTMWDYINRAMPFNSPKSLKVDEVYALTAYILHLNDLLPADGALDRASLIAFKMPNRDGNTLDHGMMSVKGKPDTKNVACMSNCATEVRLSSEYPAYALDSHGNLAEQTRALGPVEGLKVGSRTGQKVAAAAPAKGADPAELLKASGCTACHSPTQKIVGPSFREIAAKYAQDKDAEARLAAKVKQGGAGAWGSVPMPPNPGVKDADLKAMLGWILGGAK